MSYYFVAQIEITDTEEYQKYLDKAGEVFRKYNGKYLAVDNNPELLEGDWGKGRTVLIEFPTKNEFLAWYNSSEYQNILKHRLKGAICNAILVEGLK